MALRLKMVLGFTLFCGAFLSGLSNPVFMQSGRVKTNEKPTPTPARPRIVTSDSDDLNVNNVEKVKATPSPTPQTDDGEVIKIDSTLVPIPVSVTDVQGHSVTNLKLEDFLLQIDNKTEEIADISRSQIPVRLALLFDNSSSVLQARDFEKKAAVRFFRQVIRPDKDMVALYSVSSVSRLEQPLTKNVSQLIQAIEYFPKPEGATALLDSIIEAAKYLNDYQGRRIIVIVSDGDDTVSEASFEDTVKAIQAYNCQVYVVKTTDFENLVRTGSRTGSANTRALVAERRMQDISQQTGGTVYSPIDEDELNTAFTRISAELSDQYILSYYPDNEAAMRGNFRTISLVVKNHQNLTIRTRKGYFVPKR